MGTFKLQIPARSMITQILEGAAVGSCRLLAWNMRSPQRLLTANMIRANGRFESRKRDSQIVSELRAKLRQTEDLMNKLEFSLRELSSDENRFSY